MLLRLHLSIVRSVASTFPRLWRTTTTTSTALSPCPRTSVCTAGITCAPSPDLCAPRSTNRLPRNSHHHHSCLSADRSFHISRLLQSLFCDNSVLPSTLLSPTTQPPPGVKQYSGSVARHALLSQRPKPPPAIKGFLQHRQHRE